jgi:hypothetical protein
LTDSRLNQPAKEIQERIRILQNQNRFLNEEVRRLARLRTQEQSRINDQDGYNVTTNDLDLYNLI